MGKKRRPLNWLLLALVFVGGLATGFYISQQTQTCYCTFVPAKKPPARSYML